MPLRTTRVGAATGLALFALLCAAATVQATTGARQGSAARKVLEDASSEPAPAPLPEGFNGNYSALPPMAMDTRENALQSGGEFIVNAMQELLKTCVWGNFCGSKCDGRSEGLSPKAESEDGGLDQACYNHDVCLEEHKDKEASYSCELTGTPNCYCDSRLYDAAMSIYESNSKDCALWDIFCWEDRYVLAARDVALGMEARKACGEC